jgi:hypothetical protein
LNGEFTGLGEAIDLKTGELHRGSFVHGEKNGFGQITSSSRTGGPFYEYSGAFYKGQKHGIGIEVENAELMFVGGFKNGFRHGQGVYLDL